MAHADLKTALNNKVLGAFPAGREDQFWKDLRGFAQALHDSARDGPLTIFDMTIIGTADDVVRLLEESNDVAEPLESRGK